MKSRTIMKINRLFRMEESARDGVVSMCVFGIASVMGLEVIFEVIFEVIGCEVISEVSFAVVSLGVISHDVSLVGLVSCSS